MGLERNLVIFIVLPINFTFLLYLGIKILKRSNLELNRYLALFFINFAVIAVLTGIYDTIRINPEALLIHLTVIFLYYLSFGLMNIFLLLLLKSEKIITKKIQLLFFLIYILYLLTIFLFIEEISIDETTDWRPIWSINFFLFNLFTWLFFVATPVIYLTIVIYFKFTNYELKKRWLSFTIGSIGYVLIFFIILISNFLHTPILRALVYIAFFLGFPFGLLIYYGIGKKA